MLELDDNYLTGSLPEQIFPSNITSGLPALKILDLQNNRLNGTLPLELGHFHFIDKLYLSNNDFHGDLPPTLSTIGKDSETYKTIALDGNRLSGAIPPALADISLLCKY
jgi:hypothetical protein